MKQFLLIARNASGKKGYYSGRAGELFVTEKRSEAFIYQESQLQAGLRRVSMLNRTSSMHGWTFTAVISNSLLIPTKESA